MADTLLPLLLSSSGRVVLHGACLATDSGCVAVVGESMVGKSTLAAAWVARGRRFLSDDWISLRTESGRLDAMPSHPSVRLRKSQALPVDLPGYPCLDWDDGYAKRWHTFGHGSTAFPGEPAPLRAVWSLRRSPDARHLSVRKLAPRLAAERLLSHAFLVDAGSRRCWEPVLESVAGIVARVPVEEVVAPEGRAGLESLAERLEGVGR